MLLAVLFLLAHFPSNPGDLGSDTSDKNVVVQWKSDLRGVIGSEPVGLVVGRGHETKLPPSTSLWFLDSNTIVATFVTREETATLSRRDNGDVNLPTRLRAVFLGADTGQVKSTQAWPTNSRFAWIVSVYQGMFLTQRGLTLTLYTSDAKERGTLNLPQISADHWGWHAHPSPTGRSVLFAAPDVTKISETLWIWVDLEPFEIAHSWNELQTGGIAITDDTIAMTSCVWFYHCGPAVQVRGLATRWGNISPLESRSYSDPKFIDENTIFVSGHPWKLLQADGKVLLNEQAPFEGITSVSSANGKRFVVPFFKSKGGVAALDISSHAELKAISVYDAPFHQRSYRFQVKGLKIGEPSKTALSPDGSKLAILYHETVYLFHLPGMGSHQ